MKNLLNSRSLFSMVFAIGFSVVASFIPAQSFAAGPSDNVEKVDMEKVLATNSDRDKVEGDANAPVTIVEYASLSCGHCGDFYVKTLPEIRKKYIETGKAKLVFREVAGDVWSQAGFMLARCVPEDRYFSMIDVLFQKQANWINNRAELERLAQLAGIDADGFKACLNNQQVLDGVQKSTQGAQSLGVQGTPTFFINGEKYVGALSADDMSKVIDKHLQ